MRKDQCNGLLLWLELLLKAILSYLFSMGGLWMSKQLWKVTQNKENFPILSNIKCQRTIHNQQLFMSSSS